MSFLPLLLLACTPELPVAGDSAPVVDSGVRDGVDSGADSGGDTACLLYRDQDGDGWGDPSLTTPHCDTSGFVARGGDCDDRDAAVHPDADEACNQRDDDCDAAVDEGDVPLATWFQDLDLDGYGTRTATTESCAAPDGFSLSDDDCNDGDSRIHPYADETCDGVDQDCDSAVDEDPLDPADWYADTDGDGHGAPDGPVQACDAPAGTTADATDCDDNAASVHPGADETCDGQDQDCDTRVDEDPTDPGTWYADVDGDGQGDPANTVQACEAPSGHGADASDCDDGDATVHAGATELCDGVDRDCDGGVDEGVLETFYADADADGHGDPDAAVAACEAPSGHTADDQDCDDSDAGVHPGATEHCDGIDGDCDGTVDEDADDMTTWFVDADGDGHGSARSTTDACALPAGHAADDQDCDDGDASVSPAGTESCDGVDQDCDGHTDEGVETPYYWDDDGDGHGTADKTTTACAAPSGYVGNADDCYDGNADALPGQTAWFEVDRGDGSFDYDCDGSETAEDTSVSSCSLTSGGSDEEAECAGDDGWYTGAPACGDDWWWVADCALSDYWTTCYPDTWTWVALACR